MAASEEKTNQNLLQQQPGDLENEESEDKEKKRVKTRRGYQPDVLDYLIAKDIAETIEDSVRDHHSNNQDSNIQDSNNQDSNIQDSNNQYSNNQYSITNFDTSDAQKVAAASVLPGGVIVDHNVYDQGHNLDTPGVVGGAINSDHGAAAHEDHGCCDCCGGGGDGDHDHSGGDDNGCNCCCDCDGDGDNDCDCDDCDDCVIL